MRGSVDYGDGLARPVEACSGMICDTKGGDAHVRDGMKILAPIEGAAVIPVLLESGLLAGEWMAPSSV